MIKRLALLLVLGGAMPAIVVAASVTLRPDHPDRYVVQPGDTLWHIAGRFLNEPWRWTEIWESNRHLENPHLIYPGDEVLVAMEDGKPVVTLRRAGVGTGGHRTVKLSPTVRITDLDTAIPTIPIDKIQPFLKRPRVVTENELEEAPYIVSVGRAALIARPGGNIYARGFKTPDATRYVVYRKGDPYRSPPGAVEEILGYEAVHVGDAALDRAGDPAVLLLTHARREVLVGDRLLAVREEDEVDQNFMPRPPDRQVDGQIISVVEGVTQIGQYQVVVLNLGTRDGIQRGHVMAVFQRGEEFTDPIARPPAPETEQAGRIELDPDKQGGAEGLARAATDAVIAVQERVRDTIGELNPTRQAWQAVRLPDERAGTVMVFRPFERVSYALVMEATRPMHVHDAVANP